MVSRVEQKIVVVTGGGSGIGRATCELFADRGCGVVIAEFDEARGKATEEAIVAKGGRALFVQTDVTHEASIANMVTQALQQYGRIDVLVNNAAIFVLRGIEATPEEWRASLDTNVMGPALVAKHVVPVMKFNEGGAIVNLGSISSFIAQPGMVTYNASKAAVASMTRCMAMDLAPFKIRVNAVCPGTVWTPIVERRAKEEGGDRAMAETDPRWGGMPMLKRMAEPREIAQAIYFLASDEASYITAEHLMVDGGYIAQ